MSKKAVGYSEPDFNTEYAKYYDEVIGALPQEVSNALYVSPLTPGCLPDIGEAIALAQSGYSAYENGYTLESDGSIRVAVWLARRVLCRAQLNNRGVDRF